MEHLNYCRQLTKHCKAMLEVPSLDRELRARLGNVIDLHGASTKFLLPAGGRLFDDQQFRALDESVPLRLPYPYIALEYQSNGRQRGPDEPIWGREGPTYEDDSFVSAPKRVVFARERDDWIVITVAFWTTFDALWRVLPECVIPRTGYLDRTREDRGRVPIKFGQADKRVPLSDYMDELGALLCFLNVLQCSNVHVERSEPKNTGKKIKAALPFDTYHVLTIDLPSKAGDGAATGGHRSPREHLRRGHIRRLADGRRIWVNAAVVAAGRGGGVVTKDYAVRAPFGNAAS
tara:strand:- start:928 stop:1797 length:870 start_codon:yes stop_codon:yes gene_type:complete